MDTLTSMAPETFQCEKLKMCSTSLRSDIVCIRRVEPASSQPWLKLEVRLRPGVGSSEACATLDLQDSALSSHYLFLQPHFLPVLIPAWKVNCIKVRAGVQIHHSISISLLFHMPVLSCSHCSSAPKALLRVFLHKFTFPSFILFHSTVVIPVI